MAITAAICELAVRNLLVLLARVRFVIRENYWLQ